MMMPPPVMPLATTLIMLVIGALHIYIFAHRELMPLHHVDAAALTAYHSRALLSARLTLHIVVCKFTSFNILPGTIK